jgi:hypothetical protein
MKPMISTAAAALLALAACGGEGAGEADNNMTNAANNAAEAAPAAGKDPAAANATDQAAPPAAQANEGGPRATASSPSGEIRALLIGRWTDNGDCAAATDFRNDGTFSSPAGAGRWVLESEYLTLTIPGAPNGEVAIQVIDRREMETVSPMGRIGRWTRC